MVERSHSALIVFHPLKAQTILNSRVPPIQVTIKSSSYVMNVIILHWQET